ncbi:MAG: DUF1549 and DUF1553 domain-containing protein [Planctomycetes bacterium]|nr:DUF1549 and DUF1553 domain-containing protein [Planctomycetota bacterium]
MWFRPLALFTLVAGCAVLVGDIKTADAQTAQQKKAQKKALKKGMTPATPGADTTPGAPGTGTNPAGTTTPVAPPPVLGLFDAEVARYLKQIQDEKAATKTTPATPTKTTPSVKGSTKDAAELAKLIDAEIVRELAAEKLSASSRCSDDEFLRRTYLDITGTIPTADKAREFLDSKDSDKRAKLLDELLADPHYGRRMADIWTAKLFPIDSANRFVLKEPLHKWFEEEFNKNVPWNKLVTALVTAEGTVENNPATTYFLANRSVDKLTDTTAQHFMGIQLQCAQCHNHPFTTWKQTEYWGMATFYSKISVDRPKNANKGGDNTQIGVTEGNGRNKVKDFFPESTKTVPAKFLGGESPKVSEGTPYRPLLAKWLTSAENPYFSKAIVNRTWAHLFGRGFVNPIDDMLDENEASHPELLAALAQHLGTTGEFDLKYLIKAICLSETYQRTSRPTADNKDDKYKFSHMAMKAMSPEQLFDSLGQVTGFGKGGAERPGKAGVPKGTPNGPRAQFVNFFLAGAESASPVDYEAGIPQALRLMNSAIANNPAAVRTVIGSATKPEDAIERIYLATLSRRPTADEMKMLTDYVAKAGTPMTAYGDILWATLNSSEFTLVR